MFSAEEQQVEICLMKINLEEIENNLIVQRSAIPDLDTENKQKYEETMSVLHAVRYLNSCIEKLKLENICLTAKRAQLKRKCQGLSEDLKTAYMSRDKLKNALKEEDREIDLHVRQYEDTLQEKAEKFRGCRGYYDEAAVNREIDGVNEVNAQLESELFKQQKGIDALKTIAEGIRFEVPENVVEICGKTELDEKIKVLSAELEALSVKL